MPALRKGLARQQNRRHTAERTLAEIEQQVQTMLVLVFQ
jgi:hypothetical protein